MKTLTKFFASAAAAAALTVTAASPAQAQIFGRDRYDRGGIDAGDVITGVAVVGGIAAILGAFNRDGDRYGYDNRYRYRDDYQNAVNACGSEAQRYGQGGQVSITDIDRRNGSSYRVRGVIDAGYNNYGSNNYGSYGRYDQRSEGYGRYDPRAGSYGRYDQRAEGYGRYDPRAGSYGRYDVRSDRYGRNDRYGQNDRYGRYDQRVEFSCTAHSNGRVTDFDIDRRY